jgi:hypothetical protein
MKSALRHGDLLEIESQIIIRVYNVRVTKPITNNIFS